MKVSLKRVAIVDDGAFGVLLFDDIPICLTVERTYAAGQSQTVKIPSGRLLCLRSTYYKGGYPTFEIIVPGHNRILFHKGNIEDDVDGCVALGEKFGTLSGKPAVLQSGAAFATFMNRLEGVNEFYLEVT